MVVDGGREAGGGPVSLAAVPSARTVVQRRSGGLLVPNNSSPHPCCAYVCVAV